MTTKRIDIMKSKTLEWKWIYEYFINVMIHKRMSVNEKNTESYINSHFDTIENNF